MKFMSILIKEGRKEDLEKKYSDKFKEYDETLFTILNNSDVKDSNYKYADFILKNTHPNASLDEVDDIIELVKDFEQFRTNLEIKDINQYKSIDDLQSAVDRYTMSRGPKSESRKIYEDDKFIVIEPKNEEASCKYGSNTRWCVTSRGSGHFERYTKGNQSLYFIINKQNSTNKNYSKVAVQFDDSGFPRYWDTQDSQMTQREIDVLEYAFPEMMEAINEDYKNTHISKSEQYIRDIFNSFGKETMSSPNYLSSDYDLKVLVSGFENVPDETLLNGYGHTEILLKSNKDEKIIDEYAIFIFCEIINDNSFKIEVTFEGDAIGENNLQDLNLEVLKYKSVFPLNINVDPSLAAKKIRDIIANKIMVRVERNTDLINKVAGDIKVWRPNKSSYGYVFKENKGLINSLIKWLDSNKKGTKLDFLESIGKLKSKVVNGKKLYSNGKEFSPSSNWRGHFSSFFASAKLAGILKYDKQGNKFIMTKGPNFDAFKEGKLKTL